MTYYDLFSCRQTRSHTNGPFENVAKVNPNVVKMTKKIQTEQYSAPITEFTFHIEEI